MVRFGIIGTSWITDDFIHCAQLCEDFKLTAVYSRSMEKAKEFAAKYGVTDTFDNLEEMAKSDKLDAIYIASPNSCHAAQSILFLNNKKHVICEKPAAANLREQKEVIAAAKKNNCAYMEAMKTTLQPAMAIIKENLPRLGKIRRYIGNYCQYSSRYDIYKRGEYINTFQPKFANGSLMDLGVYTVYPLVYLFGKPKKIFASAVKLASGVDGETSVICQYDEMDAILNFSKITDSPNPSEILGEDATLSFLKPNAIYDIKITYNDKKRGSEQLFTAEDENFMYHEAAEFISIINSGKIESSINTFSLAEDVREVMDEIRRQINLVFPNDET